jgi:hypothetical protein
MDGADGADIWSIPSLAVACLLRRDSDDDSDGTEEMSGQRPRALLLRLAVPSAPLALYALWIRPRMLTWGATQDEAACTYPGDELVPDPDGGAMMATTLPAPPERVWPWLVQMGGGRGGWYSWDWVDNKGELSADRIVPEWQSLEVGGHLKGPTNRWTVVVVEPNRALVLQSSYGLPSGQSFDPRSGPLPRVYVDGIWGFHLLPAPGGRTRLVIRTRGRGRPRLFTRPFGLLVGEPVHLIMQTRQFHNLRTRVGAEA